MTQMSFKVVVGIRATDARAAGGRTLWESKQHKRLDSILDIQFTSSRLKWVLPGVEGEEDESQAVLGVTLAETEEETVPIAQEEVEAAFDDVTEALASSSISGRPRLYVMYRVSL